MINILLIFFLLFQGQNQDITSLLEEAQKSADSGNYDYSLSKIDEALSIAPNNYVLHYYKGFYYMQKGENDLAVDALSKSIELNDEFAEAFNTRGIVYGYQDKGDQAIKDFDRAIIIDPKFVQAYVNRGTAFIGNGDFVGARIDLEYAIELDKSYGSAYFHLGRVYMEEEDWNRAIKNIQKAIINDFINYDSWFELGNSYYQKKDYEKAIQSYTMALELNPQGHKAINNRALSYDAVGRADQAELDRATLRKISGIDFKKFENIKFKPYPSSDEIIVLSLPEGWQKEIVDTGRDDEEYYILSPKKFDNNELMPFVKVNITKNMSENFNVYSQQELLDFWKTTKETVTNTYDTYDVASQKIKQFGQYSGLIFETQRKLDKDSYPIASLEVALAKENVLISINFDCPAAQYPYFKEIYEYTIKNIALK